MPLPDKKQLWLNEIKRADWTETIVKNARVCNAHFLSEKVIQRSYKGLIIQRYCLLLLWVRLKIFYASHYVVYEMSVCMCVKQQTDDLYA